jgi:hypothetical protein
MSMSYVLIKRKEITLDEDNFLFSSIDKSNQSSQLELEALYIFRHAETIWTMAA